jgi:AbrB family looped-hinge helix DNA binding protein
VGKVTISIQVVIPREVRKQLQLKVGQKLKVVVKRQTINLVPEVPLAEMRGFLKGMDKSGLREEADPCRFVRAD